MITNFDQYFEAQKASDWELNIDDLNQEERSALKNIVLNWGDKDLEPAKNVLNDYYGLQIPNEALIKIFANDLELASENASNGISDTCQREILIDIVLLKVLGMRSWPVNGEGETVFNEFYEALVKRVAEVGGTIT